MVNNNSLENLDREMLRKELEKHIESRPQTDASAACF